MKLMLDIAYDILKERKTATFKQLFDEIKSLQKVFWKEKFPGKLLSAIEVIKKGELFTYLTTDGKFVLVGKNTWGLVENYSVKQVARLRATIGEVKEN